MNTELSGPHGSHQITYEDRYSSLGVLFYGIAASDRTVVQVELKAFQDMMMQHWMATDPTLDEAGVASVRYMDIAFDEAHRSGMGAEEAFATFEADLLREPDRYDAWTRDLILRTADAIAQASAGVNASEAKFIGRLQKLLGRN